MENSRKLVIEIELENSAFQGFDEKEEINSILNKIIKSSNIEDKKLLDTNGNSVGFCKIIEK